MEKADSGGHGFGRGHGLGLGFGHGLRVQGKGRHDAAVTTVKGVMDTSQDGMSKYEDNNN